MSELRFRRREELHEMNERIYTCKVLVKVRFIFEHITVPVVRFGMTFTCMCVRPSLGVSPFTRGRKGLHQ